MLYHLSMPGPHALTDEERKRSSRIDMAVVLALVAVSFVVAGRFDLFERFARWTRQHEALNVDELLVAAVAAIVGLAVYAWRRYGEASAEARALEAAERDLAETGERYRSLFDYHPDAVFSLSLDGRFNSVNPAAEWLSGFSGDELSHMVFTELLTPEHVEPVALAFGELLERRPQHLEAAIRRKDGRLVELALIGLPIVVADEVVGVYGMAEDVTERNRLQREVETARQTAEEASQAKSLFLANMSHEIRTPLTSVLAAEEMLSDSVLDDRQRRLAATMRRAGERLLRLVDDILDFSRIEAGKTTMAAVAFDPTALVEDVTGVARAAAIAKGLEFDSTLAPGLPRTVIGDPDRVGQVVTNLLDNAVRFTESGFVRLGVAATQTARGGTALVVTVADSGIGMTPEETARVFESFTQADPSMTRRYGGTGLGLAICQQLVELMDGTIVVDSAPGRGTVFTVRLPLEVPAAAVALD
jgi:PAS domain S-box-containing protein